MQWLEALLSLFFPSTWRDPYKTARQHYASEYVLTPGEAPVRLPPEAY